MILSQKTFALLKHMATIHPGILIEPGNTIIANDEEKSFNIFAEVEETFPVRFCTTDINKFLSTVALIDNAEIEFTDKEIIVISEDKKQKISTAMSNEKSVPDRAELSKVAKHMQIPSSFNFLLTDVDIAKAHKASSVLGINDFVFSAQGDKLFLDVINAKMEGNNFSSELGSFSRDEGAPELAKFIINKEHLKLIPGLDYKVSVRYIDMSAQGHASIALLRFEADNSDFNKLEIYCGARPIQ